MSGPLAEIAWRNLTVMALLGRTWADGNVRSSMLVPFNALEEDQVAPVVAVFTDAVRAEDNQVDGNDLFGAQSVVTLALEVGCVGAVPAQDGKGFNTWMPDTDEGIEMTIDVIRRQAMVELQSGESVWARLWRDCRVSTAALSVERGGAIEKGVRFAFKRFELRCRLVSDPVPGRALSKFWTECLAAFDADARTSDLAKTLRVLAVGEEMPAWRSWQAELGLTDDGIRGIGVAPYAGAETEGGNGALSVEIVSGDNEGAAEIVVDADKATIAVEGGEPIVVIEVPSNG